MAVSHDVNAMMFFMKTELVMPLIFLKFVYHAFLFGTMVLQ